ncbi:MAG: hypothetical protein AB7G47_02165 [Mycolicibacterium sp.]|uniref:hypothetical protein n=1 Tax=Mycolicibacterium sp. TaxID=2320850 RepID=UPI003D1248EE
MVVRRIALMVGVVLLLVGGVGLLSPISVSPGLRTVSCGTAIAPDHAAAHAAAPADSDAGAEVIRVDYSELCRYEIADRRAWTGTLAAAGALVVVVAGALALKTRRTRRTM